jgi:hypothetical protein
VPIRARDWWTVARPSGNIMVPVDQDHRVIADNLVNPTVLRTRAFATLLSAGNDVPAIYPGNSNSPFVFRILISDAADPPDSSWPGESNGVDDVVFDPMIWATELYVPASADMSRPEGIFSWATPAGGVCDSKGQRHFDGGSVDVRVDWYLGAAPGTGAPADPVFTSNLWIRCLIEADI